MFSKDSTHCFVTDMTKVTIQVVDTLSKKLDGYVEVHCRCVFVAMGKCLVGYTGCIQDSVLTTYSVEKFG